MNKQIPPHMLKNTPSALPQSLANDVSRALDAQVRDMIAVEGWAVEEVMKYFTLLNDFAGINAVIRYRKALEQ